METAIIKVKLVPTDTVQLNKAIDNIQERNTDSAKIIGADIAGSIERGGKSFTNTLSSVFGIGAMTLSGVLATAIGGINSRVEEGNKAVNETNDLFSGIKNVKGILGEETTNTDAIVINDIIKQANIGGQSLANFSQEFAKGDKGLLKNYQGMSQSEALLKFFEDSKNWSTEYKNENFGDVFGKMIGDNIAGAIANIDVSGKRASTARNIKAIGGDEELNKASERNTRLQTEEGDIKQKYQLENAKFATSEENIEARKEVLIKESDRIQNKIINYKESLEIQEGIKDGVEAINEGIQNLLSEIKNIIQNPTKENIAKQLDKPTIFNFFSPIDRSIITPLPF